MTTAITPWSAEAEQAVLCSVLLDPTAFDRVQPLSPASFWHAAHRLIWDAMLALAAARVPIDVVTLLDRLGADAERVGGLSYLNDLLGAVPSGRNAARYAQILRDHATRRELIEAAETMLEAARSGEPVADALNAAGSVLAGLQRQQSRKAPRRLVDVAVERTAHYEALQGGQVASGWATHIPGIDRALAGGLRPGKVVFIGARPSVGKTSLSAQVLLALASDGHPGLLLSQEMDSEEVADRAVANRGRIEYGRLLSGDLRDEDWSRAAEMLDTMRDLPVWVDDQGGLTLADIRSKVRSVPGLQVLVLDYLQLCARTAGSSASNRNSEIEEISRGLKALAMELGLVVICLSQLSREVEKRPGGRPVLADLRDSGSIEQDADVVIFLRRVRDLGDCWLIAAEIAKNRQGRLGEVALNFRGATQRWEESTEQIDLPAERGHSPRRGFHP